ncbi:MAG: hypothetical protein V4555_13330 [Acidobacteriota bacterium]
MDVSKILSEIDAEIARLQQARSAIIGLGGGTALAVKPKRGRPKGSVNAPKTAKPAKRKRKLSPEGLKRIQEAQKKRWAEVRKAAPKK